MSPIRGGPGRENKKEKKKVKAYVHVCVCVCEVLLPACMNLRWFLRSTYGSETVWQRHLWI